MSRRDPALLIGDMLESAAKIQRYTEGYSLEQFTADSKTADAVVRNFEIIGEAANRLPEDFKANHLEVDWQRLRGFRNRIVHDYFGIDYAIVFQIIQTYLPELITSLKILSK